MFSTVNFASIKGLMPSYPVLGYVKIGILGDERTSKAGNKYRMPVKLDHFRVTFRVRDERGQFLLDQEVHRIVGEKPLELAVSLLYDDPTLNCPARLNCYVGSKRWCHGNGEQALRLDAQGIYREQACPCPLLMSPEQATENAGKSPNDLLKCKPNGSLGMQLPYKKSSIGIYRFRTTSVESIQSILTVQGAVLMRTGGVLAGIPLRLRLYPATDNTPGGASKSWKVTLDLPPGGWDEVDAAAQEIVKARATSRLSMKAIEAQARRQMKALVEDTDEAAAIIEELFPKPITDVNGVEVLTEDEVIDGYVADLTPAEPVAAAPGGNGGPVQTPEPPAEPTPAPAEPPPPPDAALLFDEAFKQETATGAKEVKAQAIADQVKALEVLITLSGYDPHNLKKPLGQFSRGEREGFCSMLSKRIAERRAKEAAEQTALPWDK
jgi:hypothetical protein